jgi:hypothetical protein
MLSESTQLKASGIATAIALATGSAPTVAWNGAGQAYFLFDTDSAAALRGAVYSTLPALIPTTGGASSDIDFSSLYYIGLQAALERYWWALLGVAGLGAMTALTLTRRRRR